MVIQMVKFGNFLNSRPSAREAFLRLSQMIDPNDSNQKITIDLKGVEILTPSYADELIHSLENKFGKGKIEIQNMDTKVVKEAIRTVWNN